MGERSAERLLDGEFLRPTLVFEGEFGMHRNWWLRDKRIAGRAGFLYLYLLTHKSDFRVTQALAQEAMGWGKVAFLTARRELEAAGYLSAVEVRVPAGTIDASGRSIGGHRRVYFEVLDPQEPARKKTPDQVAPKDSSEGGSEAEMGEYGAEELPAGYLRELMAEDDSMATSHPQILPVDKPRLKISAGFDHPVHNSENPRVYWEEASAENPPRVFLRGKPSAGFPSEGFQPLKENKIKQYSSSSSTELGYEGPPPGGGDGLEAAKPDDDDQVVLDQETITQLRGLHPGLDAVVLVDRLQRSGQVRVAGLDLVGAASEIIGSATRRVGDPVAYVTKSVLAEPWRWAREAAEPEPQRRPARPPSVSECAERGHKWIGQWRESCVGCGEERPGWRDDRDEDLLVAHESVA